LDVQLKESWYFISDLEMIYIFLFSVIIIKYICGLQNPNTRYEKLQRWDDALKAYTAKSTQATSQHLILDATLGINACML